MVVRLVVRFNKTEDLTTIMAKIIKPLTTKEIRDAKPKAREYRLYDGNGLFISIRPSGAKVWCFNYVNENKKRTVQTIGPLEFYSLSDARTIRDEFRENLAKGLSINTSNEPTFKDVFYEWIEKWKPEITEKTYNRYKNGMNKYCLPVLANIPISKVEPKDVVKSLSEMEKKGIIDSLYTMKSVISQTLDYAIARGLCTSNSAQAVSNKAFKKQVKENHAYLPPRDLYLLVDIFKGNRSSIVTRLCLEFTLRTMCRVSEVAHAKWDEFDFNEKIWNIPAERMKMRREHVVPLTDQMISILKEVEHFKTTDYVFPSFNFKSHINGETMRMALKRNGIKSTVHGFRHLASTILNEAHKGNKKMFDSDVIEMCLSHQDANTIKATYNKAEYIEPRRAVLKWWSDFIDKCDTKENNERALKEAGISLI